jgi:thiamine-phosphate diphosphorylase
MRNLPPLVVLTDRRLCAPRSLAAVVEQAVEGGARWVLLREKDLPHDERAALRNGLHRIVIRQGGVLTLSRTAGGRGELAAFGWHLAAADPFPAGRPLLVGRSCHSLEELRAAAGEGCDYAFVSPIFETVSKPGYGPAVGLERLAEWCAAVPIPVYALGGIGEANAARCIEAGAAGVAVMGAVMRANRPERVTAAILERVSMALPRRVRPTLPDHRWVEPASGGPA